MNAKQRELQTVQLTYQRNGRLPLTVREIAWLSAKLDSYERPHDLVRGN